MTAASLHLSKPIKCGISQRLFIAYTVKQQYNMFIDEKGERTNETI